MPNYILYTLCLLLTQMPNLLSHHIQVGSNTRQPQDPNSYGSIEMLPIVSTRFSDRTVNEEKDDKDKLLTLFTNTKREVDNKIRMINALHGYINNTYEVMVGVNGYYGQLKDGFNIFSMGSRLRNKLFRQRRGYYL